MTADYMTDADIRRTLVERADRFCALTKMSRTALGLAMLRDGYVITDIEEGRDIKLSTYNRAMTWLNRAEQALAEETESPSLAAENLEKESG